MSTAPSPAATGRAATFPSERPRRMSRLFVGFLSLSLAGHGLAFLLFRVVYPPAVDLTPPRPVVSLVTPGTPENDTLLRWVAAEDPSLVAGGSPAAAPLQLPAGYQPSYASRRTPLRTVPLDEFALAIAPALGRLSVTPNSLPAETTAPASTAAPTNTQLLPGGALAGRTVLKTPAWKLAQTTALQPAEFLICLTDRGTARLCYLRRTSGSAEADAAAAEHLAGTTFSPATAGTADVWGVLTVVWGSDAYASSTSTPTPPAAP